MKTIAVIQARMHSSRLPGKVMAPLGALPVIDWVIRAAHTITGVDEVIVATTDTPADDILAEWCRSQVVPCIRGDEDDVLSRFHTAAREYEADIILRLTADCPLLDPQVCGALLRLRATHNADYASNGLPPSWPDGLDCEVFTRAALEDSVKAARRAFDKEHVTAYLIRNRDRYRHATLTCALPGLQKERWTLDTPEDFEFLQAVVRHLNVKRPPSYLEVLDVLDHHPEFRELNAAHTRNAGAVDHEPQPRITEFSRSAALLERAECTIPLGSQTFSKSRTNYPIGHSPLVLTHGEGGRVWDVDGNEYVDLVSALLPVVLGYCDPDVDYAIRQQLSSGITFSLPTILEAQLAEKLVELIPCAEKVRFGKNGSDATSAAIRLARAFTGREHVIVCGYHGWQDWYIGSTTRHKGVPGAVRGLTHTAPFNDLEAVEKILTENKDSIAALIMEPMNLFDPKPGYLEGLKALLHKHGALLVFDEVITGFRFSLGGAQQVLGTTPDLAAFGKAMGNGMPISAIVGRKDIMDEMEQIFFSGTFGGEALSLAASLALIDKMEREPVINTLWSTGKTLRTAVDALIARHDLSAIFALNGKDPWVLHSINAHPTARVEAIRTLFITEMFANGVLTLGAHNICYAHNAQDIAQVTAAYDAAFGKIAMELATGELERRLPFPAVESIFKVR